ncbi:hypothetical protein RZS08_43670, partial [Arthrospira platensis SPKY1]|nr:hypothetical protein [Arthrospira platensis SPKY1]
MSTSTQTVIQDLPQWQRDYYADPTSGLLAQAREATRRQTEIGESFGGAGVGVPQRGFMGIDAPRVSQYVTGAEEALQTGLGAYAPYLESAQ